MIEFSDRDLQQLAKHGISQEHVLGQIDIFIEGIPFIKLNRPAVLGDGIKKFSSTEEGHLIRTYNESRYDLELLKFVPASGAASRMFKSLFEFLNSYDPERSNISEFVKESGDENLQELFVRYRELPFHHKLARPVGVSFEEESVSFLDYVRQILGSDGLDFGAYPKGLLPFHKYPDHTATPFEEHLKEALEYACDGENAHLHFTISPKHMDLFRGEFKEVCPRLETASGIKIHVTYSYQRPSTDTIAVTPDDDLFRNPDGSLLFRPGGHGALIENLDEQEADIIFISNIDNVGVPQDNETRMRSKKILAGHLYEIQKQAHHYARVLESGEMEGEQLLEIKTFLEDQLNIRFLEKFFSFSIADQISILQDKINRPIRVCGMVKNVGEPGGGPFWIEDEHGHASLQIVESAQVNTSDPEQMGIFNKATHFNPVDLVCGVKDHNGVKFPLLNYVDTRQGFISHKSKDGKPLKALELPGLWNGAMAYWNTIFVEVPLETFNPVKTVNDLLKPSHQVS